MKHFAKHSASSLSQFLLVASIMAACAGTAAAQFGGQATGPADGGYAAATADEKSPVAVRAQFTAPSPGKPGYLLVTAVIEPGWAIYSITQKDSGPIRTEIQVVPPQGIRLAGPFQPSVAPEVTKEEEAFGDLPIEKHHGTVTWSAPLELGPGVDPASLRIGGKFKMQACTPNSCNPPQDIPFVAALGQGAALPVQANANWQAPATPPAAPPAAAPRATAPSAPFDLGALEIAENDEIKQTSMLLAILMGFVGGLILNLMPCVLPVIGLKILSFVEQAGHDRRHAFMLNVWYSLGLLSVFLVLATLAVTLGLGWGQLFSFSGFNISLAAVVFVMGLSFLGVWEIPIPGFVGRGKGVELAQKEGGAGAFAKGALTTLLATPCSAPFLAPALTWAVSQPPQQTYAVFTAVGLGMASPYLLIGAFPNLIAFLPKPGEWMDTFKQAMGFVLLGTVVFLLTFIPGSLVVPTIGFLFGLWAACWWIGRTPFTADPAVRSRAWFTAVAIGGAAWLATFGWLVDVMQTHFDRAVDQAIAKRLSEHPAQMGQQGSASPGTQNTTTRDSDGLPWQAFTRQALEKSIAAGNTVLVDFTADWCLTCKTLEATVLNTRDVRDAVQANRVVALQADWTHGDAEVTAMLELLGSKQVPVLAIFPVGNPNQPTVIRGGYTKQTLLDALAKAGPSKPR